MSETLDVPVVVIFQSEIDNRNRPYKNEFHMVISDEFSEEILGYPMMDLTL